MTCSLWRKSNRQPEAATLGSSILPDLISGIGPAIHLDEAAFEVALCMLPLRRLSISFPKRPFRLQTCPPNFPIGRLRRSIPRPASATDTWLPAMNALPTWHLPPRRSYSSQAHADRTRSTRSEERR